MRFKFSLIYNYRKLQSNFLNMMAYKYKHLLLFVILLAFNANGQREKPLLGGFSNIPVDELENLASNDRSYSMAYNRIQGEFSKLYNAKLGKLIAAEHQVVEGIRYKLVYQTPLGNLNVSIVVVAWRNEIYLQKMEFVPASKENDILNLQAASVLNQYRANAPMLSKVGNSLPKLQPLPFVGAPAPVVNSDLKPQTQSGNVAIQSVSQQNIKGQQKQTAPCQTPVTYKISKNNLKTNQAQPFSTIAELAKAVSASGLV